MGIISEGDRKKLKDFEASHKYMKEINDPYFGTVKIYENEQGQWIGLGEKKAFEEEEFIAEKGKIEAIVPENQLNLVSILNKYEIKTKD